MADALCEYRLRGGRIVCTVCGANFAVAGSSCGRIQTATRTTGPSGVAVRHVIGRTA